MISKEQENLMEEEYRRIICEACRKEDARVKELEKAGLWTDSLDGENGVFDDIKAETKEKITALADKYRMLSDSNIEKGA